MYTLMIIFAVIALAGGIFLYGRLNFLQYTAIALVLALIIMFVPAIIQHSHITKNMEFYQRNEDGKVYYDASEDKYYEVKLKNGWIPWDLYNLTQIEKITVPQ